MENASEALLIAGGILLTILTLSLLVYMFNNISTIGTTQAQLQEEQRLSEWNAEWEAYNKKLLYGAEVLTVINKAEQNNIEYEYNTKYTVEIKVLDNGIVITEIKEDGTVRGKDYVEQNKTAIFRCNKMEANSETGRIQNIEFEFVK